MVGRNIAFKRFEKDVTKKELAKLSNLSVPRIRVLEKETSFPDQQELKAISYALGTPLVALLEDHPEPTQADVSVIAEDENLTTTQKAYLMMLARRYVHTVSWISSLPNMPELPTPRPNDAPFPATIQNAAQWLEARGVLVVSGRTLGDSSWMTLYVGNVPVIALTNIKNAPDTRLCLMKAALALASQPHDDADALAALAPKTVMLSLFGKNRTHVGKDAYDVAFDRKLSWKAICIALMASGAITEEAYKEARQNPRIILAPPDRPQLLERLTVEATLEGHISPSKGAEILGMPEETFTRELNQKGKTWNAS